MSNTIFGLSGGGAGGGGSGGSLTFAPATYDQAVAVYGSYGISSITYSLGGNQIQKAEFGYDGAGKLISMVVTALPSMTVLRTVTIS